MKNTDYSFKIVAAVVLAGVVVAFASPTPVAQPASRLEVTPAAHVDAAAHSTDAMAGLSE